MIEMKLKDSAVICIMIAEQGKSLRSFAKEIGVSHPYLSQILNGKRNPSPLISHKLASGLNLKTEDIFLIKTVAKVNHESNMNKRVR